jgi:hypothetical protein
MRYNFKNLPSARQSEEICTKLIASMDSPMHLKSYKNIALDERIKYRGLKGIVRALAIVAGKLLVWLEIPLTRGRALHYGIALNL